jgi:hypothetical protein
MILGANQLGRVAGSAATQQRNAVQGLPVRTPVVQRNVTCNVATGPRPTAGGAPKPVQINLRDEGFDGMFQALGVLPGDQGPAHVWHVIEFLYYQSSCIGPTAIGA